MVGPFINDGGVWVKDRSHKKSVKNTENSNYKAAARIATRQADYENMMASKDWGSKNPQGFKRPGSAS